MKLTIRKPLEYLSPTSYIQARDCCLSFYLTRLSGLDLAFPPPTKQMSFGTAIDAFIKADLSSALGTKVNIADLLSSIPTDHQDTITYANTISVKFYKDGHIQRLIDEGLKKVETSYKGVMGGVSFPGTELRIGDICLYGKPDAEFPHGPLDFKSTGYLSDSPSYPVAGYTMCWPNKEEKDSYLPMHLVNKNWAIQLAIYRWLQKGICFENFPGRIEWISADGKFATYQNTVTVHFQEDLWKDIKIIWDQLKTGDIPEPCPSKFLCEPFGNPKPCVLYCPYYRTSLENEVDRFLIGTK